MCFSSYYYKLVYINDKFSKLFKSYLGKDTAYNLLIVCSMKVNTVVM